MTVSTQRKCYWDHVCRLAGDPLCKLTAVQVDRLEEVNSHVDSEVFCCRCSRVGVDEMIVVVVLQYTDR